MTGAFAAEFMAKGFETSVLAAAALVVALAEAIGYRGSRRALLATSTGVFLVAHAWQLLLPTAGLLWLCAGFAWFRRQPGGPGRALVVLGLLGLALLGLALPSLHAVSQPTIGVSAAAALGDVGSFPVLPIAVVAVSVSVLFVAHRTFTTGVVAATWSMTSLVAGVLALRFGIPLAAYYPQKMLVTAALLGVAAPAALATWGLACVDRRGGVGARLALLTGGAIVGVVTVYGLLLPASSLLGTWSTPDVSTVLRTVEAPGADRAVVVWEVGTPVDDATSQMLIDWFSAAPADPGIGLPASTVKEQCALLGAAPAPVVISARSMEEVAARFSCVDGVTTVRPSAQ